MLATVAPSARGMLMLVAPLPLAAESAMPTATVATAKSCRNKFSPSHSCSTDAKRQLDMTSATSSLQTKKKFKAVKFPASKLDFASLDGIKASFLVLKGASANVPSNPDDTFIAICHECSVGELTTSMKKIVGEDWPKTLRKNDAISVFAAKHMKKLSAKRPRADGDVPVVTTDRKKSTCGKHRFIVPSCAKTETVVFFHVCACFFFPLILYSLKSSLN